MTAVLIDKISFIFIINNHVFFLFPSVEHYNSSINREYMIEDQLNKK
jgi:hypothetical protein